MNSKNPTLRDVQREALNVILVITDLYPGLLNGQTHVDGSELIENLTSAIHHQQELHQFLNSTTGAQQRCNEVPSQPTASTTSDDPSTSPTVPPSPSSESGSTSDATS